MKRLIEVLLMAGWLAAWPVASLAQSRPLVTEDPETVPAGLILLETGVDFLHGAVYPVSGLTGTLTRIGTFGVSFGVSSIAEIQVDGGLLDRLVITRVDPTSPFGPNFIGSVSATSSFDDLTVGAKVRFLSETDRRPAIAVRFATRLPLVGTDTGLGTGTMDFTAGVALAKTVRSVRVATNLGLGIMGDPVEGDRHNQLLTYGVSVARAVGGGAELVGELNGRLDLGSDTPPIGTDSRLGVRVGGRFTHGPVRIDGAVLLGVTDRDPAWGLTLGATWVFKAFTVK